MQYLSNMSRGEAARISKKVCKNITTKCRMWDRIIHSANRHCCRHWLCCGPVPHRNPIFSRLLQILCRRVFLQSFPTERREFWARHCGCLCSGISILFLHSFFFIFFCVLFPTFAEELYEFKGKYQIQTDLCQHCYDIYSQSIQFLYHIQFLFHNIYKSIMMYG